MARTAENILEELYLANLELIGEGFPAAFNLRRRAIAEALHLGDALPGAGDERYHLIDIRSLYGRDWEYYFTPPALPADGILDGGPGEDCFRISLHNGFTDGALRREANGLVYGSLRAACAEMWDTASVYYGASADGMREPLAALNGAFVQDGAFIYVPAGCRLDKPVVADCRYSSSGEELSCFVRTLVVLEEGASAEIVVMHRNAAGNAFLVNSVCEMFAGEGAQIAFSGFSRMDASSTLLHSNHIRQSGDSTVETVWTALGGLTTRISHCTDLAGEGAESRLDALYLAPEAETIAFDVRADHNAPGCRSYEMVKGVASGTARGSFTGMAYVAPGAQRTEAMQQSRNIEMSPTAKIYARPRLEIYADDVKCSHGATVGQLDPEAVWYMRQRGIDVDSARRLQLEGFIKDVAGRYRWGGELFGSAVQEYVDKL